MSEGDGLDSGRCLKRGLHTAGNERRAEPRECIGLERASVWEEVGVEERLLDTFRGRPNATAERHKVRLK